MLSRIINDPITVTEERTSIEKELVSEQEEQKEGWEPGEIHLEFWRHRPR